ncbi:MAG: YIP1 family protein, partial [Limisphaerales bacterium]
MSLAARLLNVFAVPGEVFAEVKAARATLSNWLIPAICSAIVGALSAVVIFSQPAVVQQLHEQQTKAMDRQVQAGKLTQEKADQMLKVMERFTGPTMLMIFGSGGAVVASFIHVIWWGFVLWLLAKLFLKVSVPFPKALEVAGLAMMINVLGAIVAMLLIVNLGRVGATPSLALAVSDFDATRKSHLFLGAANVFYFWLVGVMSVGLARLAAVPFLRAAWLVLTYWIPQQ